MMLIPSLKSKTKKLAILDLTTSGVLYLPLRAYNGKMELLVTVGAKVKKYEQIAASKGNLATSIHAPVSGTITAVETIDNEVYAVLKNDFEETEVAKRNTIIPESLTREALIQHIKDNGIIGSGGAQFPTQVKYNGISKPIDYFIINGVECEPYLSADYALMKEKTASLLQVLGLLQKILQIKQLVFGIEKQHKELQSILLTEADKQKLSIDIKLLQNTYPQGGELQLIKAVTGKELPKGSIPANMEYW